MELAGFSTSGAGLAVLTADVKLSATEGGAAIFEFDGAAGVP